MHVIVGLGNPGSEYVHTRHNVGFRVVDALSVAVSQRFSFQKKVNAEVAHLDVTTQIQPRTLNTQMEIAPASQPASISKQKTELYLLKPQTFMNKSGESVRALYEYFGGGKPTPETLQQLFVVFDDLDIPIGKFKIQLAKGPKVHNGLTSLYQHLGSTAFYHVRVGIENRGEDRTAYPGDRYVLSKFNSQEDDILKQVVPQLVQELLKLAKVR